MRIFTHKIPPKTIYYIHNILKKKKKQGKMQKKWKNYEKYGIIL